MPHYIALLKWTEKGAQDVKDTPKRVAELTRMIEQIGAFFTMGEDDLGGFVEEPSDDIAMQEALQVGKAGNARTVTRKAWTIEEGATVIAKPP